MGIDLLAMYSCFPINKIELVNMIIFDPILQIFNKAESKYLDYLTHLKL